MQTADNKYFNPLNSKLAIQAGRNLCNDDAVVSDRQEIGLQLAAAMPVARHRRNLGDNPVDPQARFRATGHNDAAHSAISSLNQSWAG